MNSLQNYLDSASASVDESFVDILQKEALQSADACASERARNDKLAKKIQKLEEKLEASKGVKSSFASALKRKVKRFAAPKKTDIGQSFEIERSVTVVIPTYKETPFISQAVKSVREQTGNIDIEIFVVVNGPNYDWFEKVKRDFSDARVEYIEQKGAAFARNYAIQHVKKPFLLFLDDDDYITSGYIKTLFNCWEEGADIACAYFSDEGEKSFNSRNYLNVAIKRLQRKGKKTSSFVGIFSTAAGKMYRTDFLRSCIPFNTTLPNSEDIMFWAENYDKVSNVIATSCDESETYVRRLTENSLSRPCEEDKYKFYITERLLVISKFEEIFFTRATSNSHRNFLVNLINAQTNHIISYFESLSDAEKEQARAELYAYEGKCLNKGLFSDKSAIAFCHNFAPVVDPSAVVATKRLYEINEFEGEPLRWKVFSKDTRDVFKEDKTWEKYYAGFAYVEHIKTAGKTLLHPRNQVDYALTAYMFAKDTDAEIIYSRSMFPGSHMAAYLYKKEHPQAKWYAEFSDPLALDALGKKRDDSVFLNEEDEELRGFYQNLELLTYEFADIVIFTNKVQRDFMFSYCSDSDLAKTVKEKSLVWAHPIIDSRYVNLIKSNYTIDESKINIGYFGSFYKSRNTDDLLKLARRKDIVLHLFVTKPEKIEHLRQSNIRIEKVRPYFEFLNLASKMDYLFLNDMQSIDGITPWRPSKLSDYLASGSSIIARCNEGSPLSMIETEQVLKVKDIDDEFIAGLKKPQKK